MNISQPDTIASSRSDSFDELFHDEAQLKNLLAVFAHELRDPLAPLQNITDLLNLKQDKTEEEEWMASVMNRQIAHMTHLIDDLLDVARISSNTLALRIERINLNDVLTTAIEATKPIMDSAGHTFISTLPSRSIYLNGDPARLAQVITNILTNASNYTPGGGLIKITAERSRSTAIITITDNGVGISSDVLQGVVKNAFGIGITLARELTELHGGKITVESIEGEGSTFTIQIPIRDSAEELEHDELPVESPLSKDLRVLIVDDNKDATNTMKMLLEAQGCVVEAGYDGFEAYSYAEKFKPDAMLLDIGMPKINGYELAQMIRRQPWGEEIILIATTGLGQDSDKRRSLAAGFNYHFVKPVNFGALRELLATIPSKKATL